jgi:hypothetical protein
MPATNEYQTKLVLSETGRTARLFHKNGRLIAEFLVHGPLLEVTTNCQENKEIIKGRSNVFRAEIFGLAGYEYLNMTDERIEER